MPHLRISVPPQNDGRSVVALSGAIDLACVNALERRLLETAEDSPRLVVDMSGVDFCDCSGLGVFLRVLEELTARGGSLTLTGAGAAARRVFDLTGAGSRFSLLAPPTSSLVHGSAAPPTPSAPARSGNGAGAVGHSTVKAFLDGRQQAAPDRLHRADISRQRGRTGRAGADA